MFVADDTIVAVSTAAGSAPRAIVRLSGPAALVLAAEVFLPARAMEALPGFSLAQGRVRIEPGGIEVPAQGYVFRAPRSYTRQDVAELHLPGPAVLAGAVVDRLVAAGARQAGPGEFTARAFFSGRIDLSAAQAVADVIDAAGEAQLRSAVRAMTGEVRRLCRQAAERLAEALATVEASIDLAEEDIQLAPPGELAEALRSAAAELHRTAERAVQMPETADRPTVVIAGRPNVGKSSLLNALTGSDRAIVCALAGTTRDVLSAAMTLAGQPVLLQDAAGLAQPADTLSAAAHDAARQAASAADALIFVLDATRDDADDSFALLGDIRRLNPRAPLLLAANKIDLLGPAWPDRLKGLPRAPEAPAPLGVCCLSGEGLDALRSALAEALNLRAARGGEGLGLHYRQKRRLLAAAEAARRAADLLAPAGEIAQVAELAAVELRTALAELGQISGQIVAEDILGRIFTRFCVGK